MSFSLIIVSIALLLIIVAFISRRSTFFIRLRANTLHLAERLIANYVRQITIRQYCRLLLASSQYQYSMVPGNLPINLPIEHSYVPMRLSSLDRKKNLNINEIPFQDFPGCMWITGGPGSGKTTLLKRLIVDASKEVLATGTGQLPILIDVRSLLPLSGEA